MIPIQEIVVRTDKGARLTLHIVSQLPAGIDPEPGAKASFKAEALVFDPANDPRMLLYTINQTFDSSLDAFVKLMDWVANHCKRTGQKVISIDNPCNCEFVPEQLQQPAAERAGFMVEVTVNATRAG